MPIEESLSILLAEMLALRTRTPQPRASVSMTDRMTTLDTFEMMIRLDDLAVSASLSGVNKGLDQWTQVDCASLVRRLADEPRSFLLPVLLTVSPRGLARLAGHLTFFHWMEAARAANNLTAEQLAGIRQDLYLEDYLAGHGHTRPKLSLPLMFGLPMPSVLRVVQSARFRMGMLGEDGYDEALARYVRFFC